MIGEERRRHEGVILRSGDQGTRLFVMGHSERCFSLSTGLLDMRQKDDDDDHDDEFQDAARCSTGAGGIGCAGSESGLSHGKAQVVRGEKNVQLGQRKQAPSLIHFSC